VTLASGKRPVRSSIRRPKLLVVVEREHEVGPAFALQRPMGTELSLDPPAQAQKCCQDAPCFG
jgi:hypothetical protein